MITVAAMGPMMRTVTCLERDYASRLCREEVEQLGSRQLAAEDHRTTLFGATPSASIELCVSGRMSGEL
ncbi:hypothetical protein [Sphingomonas koreensis]|uniref:hypothetical protein n=1 Tax=Sphingomonas koreensis TaxID=93064 RepID=UPI00082ED7F2|nr:hypothetical protein [Sphingomonas koreensis]PJI88810.1 hypothetical protein BDW16_2102 [Sphingomonas koreensis]